MPNNLTPTPAEIIEERLSDYVLNGLTGEERRRKLDALFNLAKLSSVTVLRAGAAGNVTCKQAVPEILSLLKQLK